MSAYKSVRLEQEFSLHFQGSILIYLSPGPEVNGLLQYFICKHNNLLVRPSSLDKPSLLFARDLLSLLGYLVLPRIEIKKIVRDALKWRKNKGKVQGNQ